MLADCAPRCNAVALCQAFRECVVHSRLFQGQGARVQKTLFIVIRNDNVKMCRSAHPLLQRCGKFYFHVGTTESKTQARQSYAKQGYSFSETITLLVPV